MVLRSKFVLKTIGITPLVDHNWGFHHFFLLTGRNGLFLAQIHPLMKNFLPTFLWFLVLTGNVIFGQNVSILPGETTTLETAAVFNSDFGPSNTSGSGFSCNFNKGRGVISIGAEFQSDNYSSWDEIRVAFYYNGSWKEVLQLRCINPSTGADATSTTPVYTNWLGETVANNYMTHPTYTNASKVVKTCGHFADRHVNMFMRDMGNLEVYHGNYLPMAGKINYRNTPADTFMYGIQTARYTKTGEFYPCKNDPNPATLKTTGYDIGNHRHFGNLPGVTFNQYSPDIAVIIVNIANLPPDMLESPNFKVHVYALSLGNNHNRIYETTYSNQNFMAMGPMSVVASKDLCGKVKLTWSNSNNALPGDGNVAIKNVIFRDGNYLATIAGTATTYDDFTAVQDVKYNYTIRHVAFSETGETYYRSPESAVSEGYMKLSPDQPISPSATSDDCASKINLQWGFNGVNPQSFKIDRATSAGGPFTTIATVGGANRSYLNNTSVTRGTNYFYRIYAVSSCSVQSLTYADVSGISPADPAMATAVAAVSNTVTNSVDLTWTDNANNETKYQIVRTDDQGNTVLTDVNANQTTYNDASAANCRLYTYKVRVFNSCVLSGIVSTSQATVTLPPPNIGATFDATHKIIASKGYFSNRVELQWSNNNGNALDNFKIYRKQLGTALDSVQIGAVSASASTFIDNTCDARVFYRYTVIGARDCNGSTLYSNISSDIGFRNPTGIVSGHIEYNGGVAVSGAKVAIQQSGALSGNSLDLNAGGTVTIADNTTLEPGSQMRCEFWYKPETSFAAGNVLNKTNAFNFRYNGSNYVANVYTGGTAKTVTLLSNPFSLGNWHHVSLNYDGASLKVFVNGVLKGSVAATGNVDDNVNPLVFGSATSDFKLDEFRLMGQSQVDSVITIEANRILNGDETAFRCNLHFDESVGSYAYDVSKVGSFFNANHSTLSGSVAWSTDIPTSSQLGYFGVTNALGNYYASGVRYGGTGENYIIVPSYQTHAFAPNSKSVYIGDASLVYNNQDFTDISSFPVTGTLYYKNTTCPVPGATLKIDGLAVISNGVPAVTDANGTFSISVPIGNHFVSTDKPFHTMEDARYPITGTHNFQAPVNSIAFTDSTLVKVVGRIVGGKVEADKAPGLGRSKNNIGKGRVRLATPIAGSPCFTVAVSTNPLTGEYIMRVPPLGYKVDSVYVITNSLVINATNLSNANQLIDLTNAFNETAVKDTLRDSNGGVVSVDSTKYNYRRDFIYRNTPVVNVTLADGTKFIGADTLTFGSTKIPVKPETSSLGTYGWGPFNWPVFKESKNYAAKITASEIYTNTDNGGKDTVRLSGAVHITNDLVDGTDPNANFNFSNGVATYSFTCGSPNIATNALVPDLSYTKDIQIVVVPDDAASVSWLPNTVNTPTNKNYHAIVLGKKITGTGISTQGPEQVDFILRDPPGSGSSSTWTSGTTVETSKFFTAGGASNVGVSTEVRLGNKTMFGLGVITEFDMENRVEIGLSVQSSGSDEDGLVEQVTSSYAVSTRDDAGNVGANADIFIGRSKNWLVGPTTNVELVDVTKCGPDCFGPTVAGKRLSKMYGYAVAPDQTRTRFSYTQNEIETVVIPGLESLRNSYLLSPTGKYTSNVLFSNPNFGSNNDDPLWGGARTTTTSTEYEFADTTGASYTFKGFKGKIADTVRIINTQIAIWKQTLARNEKEKLACKNNTAFISGYIDVLGMQIPIYTTPLMLDNFTLGSAVVTNAYTSSKTAQSTSTWELNISESLNGGIGGFIGGAGVLVKPSLTIDETVGGTKSKSTTTENSFEYTLTDGDPGDIMSIDVYKLGSGNVFITRGGQTMCPYEDKVVCHYYDPSSVNGYIGSHSYSANGYATIANATVQREMPNISITPALQYNIPSNQSAVYQLVLTNQSPLSVNNDIDMQVRVASVSNPYGAVLKIDGNNANTIINIPSGGSVIKTLTIERGPVEIEYDSLMVIFGSACSEDIADTSYVTVHFVPTCTDLSISTPANNFIVNNNNNNIQQVSITDYNYNYGASNSNTVTASQHPNIGLEKIGFEFKPSNSSQWLQIQDFYKSQTVPPTPTYSMIPTGQIYTPYTWAVAPATFPDGNYEIRAVSHCYNKDGSYAVVYSPVLGGVMDRVNPHAFGTPSPADGILDPNDDISIQFNEPIDISSLNYAPASNPGSTFDVRGVLNGTTVRHSESLNFDGTSDYAHVTGGASLQKRSFTVEFWAKFNPTGATQVVMSQGTDAQQKMDIGFDASNKLFFNLYNQSVTATAAVAIPTDWHHYVVTYDYANTDASIYVDGTLSTTNNNFVCDYIGSGKLAFGKALPAGNNFFNGNIHEVRLWNKVRTVAEVVMTMNIQLSRSQSGLMYNWKMDEADGNVAKDDIRSRNADIFGATWEVNPNGNAASFDGIDDNIQISSGNIAINKEMDFTLEFWFNSNQAGVATLFSNGKGDGIGADSLYAWNIEKDAAGKIHIKHKGLDFVATNTNYFNGTWHHFALVLQRTGNLSAYIDGNLQNSVLATSFNNLAGSFMYLGARGYQTGSVTNYDNFFNGKMDEFRLWNTARKTEQVKRDKQNRMLGDEHGLLSFVPFENYAVVLGTPSLTPTFNDQGLNTLTVTPQNGPTLVSQTPTVKLPRPVQSVNYTWSLNNDKIILSSTTPPALIENVTLDITVKNARDLHGNIMQSPKTWIAYINKNQIKWQDDQFTFEKTVDSVITFVAPIVNSGGATKVFTIGNIPNWMNASATTGNIAPNSVQNITFTIPAGQSIGDYTTDLTLTTDFGFDEVLQINLKVKGITPTWSVNPSNFQYSMNIFGEMKIDNVISTNPENKIAAFKNGVICGVANLQYVPAYDRYEAFLNVYSNNITGDSIKFNLYDATSGLTFVNVTPSVMFVDNDVLGTVANPITFVANTEVKLNIPLNTGWTWISLPLKSGRMQNSNLLMSSVSNTTGDVVLSSSSFDQYETGQGWFGNISQGSGFFNNQSYRVKCLSADTLVHIGTRIHPDSTLAVVNIQTGWNWIGYVSTKSLPLTEALGNYNAVTGDLIKSQYAFSYYDNATGWSGSLTFMKPGIGYMLKSSAPGTFNYPLTSYLSKMSQVNEVTTEQHVFPFAPEAYANTMSAIITGNICNEALDQGNVAIGAFDATNTLRGYAFPTASGNTYNFYLTLYSNVDGETLNLKYFNTTNGSVINTNSVMSFTTDALAGTPSTPAVANVAASEACNPVSIATGVNNIDNSTNISVYPNPFNDHISISFEKAVNCKVELIDVLGRVHYVANVNNKKESVFTIVPSTTLSNGVYYIRMTGDVNKQIKLIKTH